MNHINDKRVPQDPESSIAITQPHWDARWRDVGSVFDPSYDRATRALRRWVDGMEAALNAKRP